VKEEEIPKLGKLERGAKHTWKEKIEVYFHQDQLTDCEKMTGNKKRQPRDKKEQKRNSNLENLRTNQPTNLCMPIGGSFLSNFQTA